MRSREGSGMLLMSYLACNMMMRAEYAPLIPSWVRKKTRNKTKERYQKKSTKMSGNETTFQG
eukprot:8637102-Ditylum_brightwellii.AAC.1